MVIGLLLIGIIMVFSASQYMAANGAINDGLYYLKRQCLWAALGLVVMAFMLRINYHMPQRLALPRPIARSFALFW